MERLMRQLGPVLAITLGVAAPASAETVSGDVETCSRAEVQGEQTLCHVLDVPAPAGEVWELISTAEGWRTWAAPLAAIDLRSGGLLETSYAPNARIGDPGNIRNRVLAFAPERLLVIQIADAPPGFPHTELARELTTAIELEPLDATHTRVRITMMGYRDAPGFETLYAFFDRGNALTLAKLAERIERGPVDWEAAPVVPMERQ
jgi:uncharacterized protein YndB with AHSA1/START domain